MDTDADLSTLIHRRDHLNVLRYVRMHQIRDPELVVRHGKSLLGDDLSSNKGSGVGGGRSLDGLARLAALEQVGYAALDCHNIDLTDLCLQRLTESGIVTDDVPRYRLLLGRKLEAVGDYVGAMIVYDELLKSNPCNLMALKRKYCVWKAQPGKQVEAMDALNQYLSQNYSDVAAWYEMAHMRLELLGDYAGAAYALEETLLGVPSDPMLHIELAECYVTMGGIDHCALARKHMAQALELDPQNRRALFGLICAANAYLVEAEAATSASNSSSGRKDTSAAATAQAAALAENEHEIAVAKELVKYGAEHILKQYRGSKMFPAVKTLMNEYTQDL